MREELKDKEKYMNDDEKPIQLWLLVLVIGFFIIIGSFVGILAVPSHLETLNDELEDAEESYWDWHFPSSWMRDEFGEARCQEMAEYFKEENERLESDIETTQAIQGALPYVILLGMVIAFFGLIAKYYTPKDISIKPNEEVSVQDENAKKILKIRGSVWKSLNRHLECKKFIKSPYMICQSFCHHGSSLFPLSFSIIY